MHYDIYDCKSMHYYKISVYYLGVSHELLCNSTSEFKNGIVILYIYWK